MAITENQIKKGTANINLKDLLTLVLDSVKEDLDDEQEIKLKKLIIAFKGAIYMFGVDAVYNEPGIIHHEMMVIDSINEQIAKEK
jgi:hypothetical protein